MGSLLQLSDIAQLAHPEDAHLLRRRLADLLNRRQVNFPGAQPVSFARKHFQNLQLTEYDAPLCLACSRPIDTSQLLSLRKDGRHPLSTLPYLLPRRRQEHRDTHAYRP